MRTRAKKGMGKDRYVSGTQYVDRDKTDSRNTAINLPEGMERFKFESDKDYFLDIIPYRTGEGNPNADKGFNYFERTFYVHRRCGPGGEDYICPKQTFGKKSCAVCDAADAMFDNYDALGEKAKKRVREKAGAIRAKKRQLFHVLNTRRRDDGVMVMEEAYWTFGRHLKRALQHLKESAPERMFHSLTDGFTLQVQVEKGKFVTPDGNSVVTYQPARIDFVERKKQYPSSFRKENTCCLDKCIVPITPEALSKIFHQSEEEDDSSVSKRSKKGRSMKRKTNAKKLGIKKGSKVEHGDLGECVVNAVSKDGLNLTLKDEDGDLHKNVGVLEVTLVEDKKKATKGKKKPAAKKKPVKKGKKKDEDEDEDDEDEEDDDDEDEEDEDSDDDDEDEDEDEDDEDDEDEDDEDEDDDEDDDED